MSIKCVVTDFDGTLLTDQKIIDRRNLAALNRLRQQKIFVIVATGRSYGSFFNALSQMAPGFAGNAVPIDYVVFSTGAGILEFWTRRILFEKSIRAAEIRSITTYFDRRKIDYMVHKKIPQTGHLLYKSHGGKNPDFEHRLALYSRYAVPLDRFDRQFESATEVLAILGRHHGARTVSAIRGDLAQFSVIPATSPLDHQSLWIEVFDKNVSKSASTNWLCRRLNISSEQVIAVGNDYNDKDLLQWAARGYVVDNAPHALKKQFICVRSNNEAGFEDALVTAGVIKKPI